MLQLICLKAKQINNATLVKDKSARVKTQFSLWAFTVQHLGQRSDYKNHLGLRKVKRIHKKVVGRQEI